MTLSLPTFGLGDALMLVATAAFWVGALRLDGRATRVRFGLAGLGSLAWMVAGDAGPLWLETLVLVAIFALAYPWTAAPVDAPVTP